MKTIPLEEVLKRVQVLPEALQIAVFSRHTRDAILQHCTLREIPSDKIYSVGMLTSDVLLGYLRPELFATEIQKETGMDELKAQHIAHDIDMEVFSEVRLELKKLYPPTILTPNVQAQGFAAGQAPAAPAPVVKPKYVIPIPERFQNKSFPGMAPAPQKQEAPAVQTAPVAPVAAPEPAKQTPIPPQQPIIENKPAESIPVITPEQETKAPEIQKPIVEKKPEQTTIDVSGLSVTVLQNTAQAQQTTRPTLKLGEKPTQPEIKVAQTVEPSGVKINPVVPLPTFIGARFQQPSEDATKDSEQKIKEMASKFAVSSTAQPKPPQESAYKEKVDETKKPGTVDLSKF